MKCHAKYLDTGFVKSCNLTNYAKYTWIVVITAKLRLNLYYKYLRWLDTVIAYPLTKKLFDLISCNSGAPLVSAEIFNNKVTTDNC